MPENEVLAQALGLSEPAARKLSERNILRNVIKHPFFLDVIEAIEEKTNGYNTRIVQFGKFLKAGSGDDISRN